MQPPRGRRFEGGDRDQLNEAIQRVIEGEDEAALHPDDADPDIRIPAPKEPEVNPEVYRDVERLLFRGFLTLYGEVNGVPFIFKSLNHHEFEMLQWVAGSETGAPNDRYYAAFIAYGVFMIDGQNILSERDRWVPRIQETFRALPTNARSKVVRFLSEVNRKASNAVALTEAYQMENFSRFRWAQLKGLDLMVPGCTGIQGTDGLGMNYGQLVWRALNYYEDMKEQAERDWDHAKFVGGCFVGGKEIRKVHNQDQERRRKEREERLERKDKVIRQVVFGEDEEAQAKKGPIKIVARTVEELASQLEKDLRGEKDWHDEVVAREEARIRQTIRDRQQKLREMSAAKEADSRLPYMASTDTTGLTAEQVRERVLRRRQLEAQANASRVVYPEMMDERMENFMRKYVDPDDTYQPPGAVRSDVRQTDRDPSGAHPIPPARPRATPFRR